MIGRNKERKDIPNRRRIAQSPTVANERPKPLRTPTGFRRNRTLTGSSSAHVASSNELRAELQSPRAHVHHLHRHRRHLIRRLLVVLFAILALYIVASQLVATTHIATIRQYDKQLDTSVAKKYQKTVDDYYAANPLQRFRPALDVLSLTGFVQASHPEVTTVAVSLTGEFGQAEVAFGFRQPVARWVVDGHTQYVDQDGVVFSENIQAAPKVTIVDKNDITVQSKYVTSNRFLSFVGSVVGSLKKQGFTVTRATIPALTTRQLEVQLSSVKYYFKLTVDRSAGEQAEDIARIVAHMRRTGESPQYVDVRTRGKAAYKE